MSYVLTPLAFDNFARADENPLNPANWAEFEPLAPLQIVGMQCQGTVLEQDNDALYTGVALPNDQFCQFTVGTVTGAVGGFVRAALSGDGYAVDLGPAGPSCEVDLVVGVGFFETSIGNYIGAVNAGDVFVLGCIGTTIFVLQNGTQIISATDSTLATGTSGLIVGPVAALGDTFITDFVTGSAAFSTPPTPPVPPLPPQSKRANIDTALLAQLDAAYGWSIPSSMHFRMWDGEKKVDATDQPCLFLRRIAEEVTGLSAYGVNKYVLKYEVWIYAAVDSNDISQNPYATFDAIIDAVDTAIAPNPAVGKNNLSGLVDNCRINGQILIADGSDDGQAVIRIIIEVFTGS